MQAGIGIPGPADAADRGRPLVVTSDGELLDELVGLAGAGGVEVSVAVDALAAEERWASAPLVVVGADQVAPLARRNLPRRLGVILVDRAVGQDTSTEPCSPVDAMAEPSGWSGAAALHAEHLVVLPDARSWLVTRFAECRPRALRYAAPVVAFVSANPGAGASVLAAGVALTARRQGLATLLVGSDPYNIVAEPYGVGPDLYGAGPNSNAYGVSGDGGRMGPIGGAVELLGTATGEACATGDPGRFEPEDGTLAVLSFDRRDGAAVPPDAMAAALRAARHGRDFVVVDLPHVRDDASRLALTCADQTYLTVVAEIRECAAATRIAAAVRRHCPRLALVVRVVTRRGLRPDEVAEALDLPLVGVLPPEPALRRTPPPADPGRVVAALCRRLFAQTGAARRAGSYRAEPSLGTSEVVQ